MSPVAAGLDSLLALLLVAALVLGVRLNRRLKTLRDSQAGFAAAVLELNQAAARAEAGLSALKTAHEDAHEELLSRIEVARGLAAKLERAGLDAERRLPVAPRMTEPEPRLAAASVPTGGALAAIAALAQGRAAPRAQEPSPASPDPAPERFASPPPLRRSVRGAFDEELFEANAVNRADPFALGALERSAMERDRRTAEPAIAQRPGPASQPPPLEPPLDLGPLPDPLSKWKTVR